MAEKTKVPIDRAHGTTKGTMSAWKRTTFGRNKGGAGKPAGQAKLRFLVPPPSGWPANTEPYDR